MGRIPKKRKVADAKVDKNKVYSLKEASSIVKTINTTKFDASVDLHIRLGVDPKKADQAIRGTVTLPHGTGKTKKVLVLCPPDKEADARAAGGRGRGGKEGRCTRKRRHEAEEVGTPDRLGAGREPGVFVCATRIACSSISMRQSTAPARGRPGGKSTPGAT